MDILQSVIEKYPQKRSNVVVLNNEKNRGLAYCRNIGIQNAHGDYIMHVDSDDYIENNAVKTLVEKMRQSNADIVVSDFFLVVPQGIVKKEFNFSVAKVDYLKLTLRREVPVCIWGKLYKRELYTKNSIVIPDNIDFGEDMVTLPRLVYYANKIVKVAPFYYYNQSNVNSYTKRIGEKAILSVIRTEQTLRDFFSNKMDSKELNELLSVYMQKMRAETLFYTSRELRKKYAGLFAQCGYVNLRLISSFRQKLFILFFDRHFYHLSDWYLGCYHFFQNCKRRLLR